MPNTTTNFKLIKPLVTDLYDIEVQNQNMDIIDAALKELESIPVATTENYGKVKLLPLPAELSEDETGFVMPDGQLVTYEDSKGYAASAYAICAINQVFTLSLDDIDEQLAEISNAHLALKERVDNLLDFEEVEF